MPHQRDRHILSQFQRRLSLFPIVGLLGARQTGKSTILREILPKSRKVHYITLDRDENKMAASSRPTLFVQGLESPSIETVCIDEVQKAAVLFDTLKAEVDEKRRLGRFAISGSTEFSKKTGIHDALTGRIALLRLFPLNVAEIVGVKPRFPLLDPIKVASTKNHIPLQEPMRWLDRGGMPGIFAVRDATSRQSLFENWIDAACARDLAQFHINRFNPDLARRILFETARADCPERAEIARALGKQPRQIEAYFEAFKALFILYEIDPYKTGVGKSQFYLFDSGIAASMGASKERCLQTWFLNECFSQFSYAGEMRPDLFHYRTSRGSTLDFIVEGKNTRYAVKLCHDETPSTYFMRSVEAFHTKHKSISVIVAAPCLHIKRESEDGLIRIIPWSALV